MELLVIYLYEFHGIDFGYMIVTDNWNNSLHKKFLLDRWID